MPPSGDTRGASTSIAGVRDEYKRAIGIFPLQLPKGYAFPAESAVAEPVGQTGTQFSEGTGAAEAYFFWQNATATAAYAAYLRGDRRYSTQLLDIAESGYGTKVRKMYVSDPDNSFVIESLAPSRQGNFASLRVHGIDQFISHAPTRAIATMAGDVF